MLVAAVLSSALLLQDTTQRSIPKDAYADARTAELVAHTRAARERNERLVTSYTANVTQRIGVGIHAVSRDRMLYRQELAAKISWKRDGKSSIEVQGAREGIPVVKRNDGIPDDLEDQARWLVINPAEDYLRIVGMADDDDGFVYPLREGGERDYRFIAGDSTVIALPTGKRIRLIELKILPRRSDWKLMSGSLWFDADTYGLVRAVFRPARPYEFRRDSDPDDREDVPSWVNPTAEVKYVTLEYGLFENRWWMLRYAAIDAVGKMGSWLGMPVRLERVYSDYEVEGGTPPPPGSTFQPAGTTHRVERDAAGQPIDSATRKFRRDSVEKVTKECIDRATSDDSMSTAAGRRGIRRRISACTHRSDQDSVLAVVIPDDTLSLLKSQALGPPILAMGDMISEDEIKGLSQFIDKIPGQPWGSRLELPHGVVGTLLQRARYNRVESLSLGLGGKADFGKLVLDAEGRIGIADAWPNAEAGLSWSALGTNVRLAGYRRLTAANPDTKPFGPVNSVFGFLAHRDDGEYYRALGADLVQTTGSGWLVSRIYYEHQTNARVETNFSLPHVWGSDAIFRPNILADQANQVGASVTLRGSKPLSRSFTLSGETFLEGATGDFDFGRGSATLRALITPEGPIAVALSGSAGTSVGTVPVQSFFFLGGPATLRGYDGGVLGGTAFWSGRVEVANSFPAARISAFTDFGWAGPKDAFSTGRPLLGGGVGASFLDGLVRVDLSHGFRGPKGWRFDVYFDGIL